MQDRLTAMNNGLDTYQFVWMRIGNVSTPSQPRPPIVNSPANVAAWAAWDAAVARTSNMIQTLEAFNGRHFYDFEGLRVGQNNGANGVWTSSSTSTGGGGGVAKQIFGAVTINLEQLRHPVAKL